MQRRPMQGLNFEALTEDLRLRRRLFIGSYSIPNSNMNRKRNAVFRAVNSYVLFSLAAQLARERVPATPIRIPKKNSDPKFYSGLG